MSRFFVLCPLVTGLLFALSCPAHTAPPQNKTQSDSREQHQGDTDLYGDPLPEGAISRLGTVRWRHSGTVHSLTFSPSGKAWSGI
jgi:hypothetical protein